MTYKQTCNPHRAKGVKRQVIALRDDDPSMTQSAMARVIGCSREAVRIVLNKLDLELVPWVPDTMPRCAVCGIRLRMRELTYCSRACHQAHCRQKNPRINALCPVCQTWFTHRKYDKGVYCSHKCGGIYAGRHYGFGRNRSKEVDDET